MHHMLWSHAWPWSSVGCGEGVEFLYWCENEKSWRSNLTTDRESMLSCSYHGGWYNEIHLQFLFLAMQDLSKLRWLRKMMHWEIHIFWFEGCLKILVELDFCSTVKKQGLSGNMYNWNPRWWVCKVFILNKNTIFDERTNYLVSSSIK